MGIRLRKTEESTAEVEFEDMSADNVEVSYSTLSVTLSIEYSDIDWDVATSEIEVD